jgi:hypothetical protein
MKAKRQQQQQQTSRAKNFEFFVMSSSKLDQARLGAVQEECAKYQTKVSQFSDGVADSVGASKMTHDHAMNTEKENIKSMNKLAQAKQTEIAQLQESTTEIKTKNFQKLTVFFCFPCRTCDREEFV